MVSWADPDGHAVLARLGSATLAPDPPVHESPDIVALLEGEFRLTEDGEAAERMVHSPVQVARLYERHGERFAEAMAGWFTSVVFDRNASRLVISNDRFGTRPLYYHHDGERLIFASNTRMITALGRLQPQHDRVALAEFLRYQQLLDDRSLFEEIKLLPPGSRLIFALDSNELRLESYWKLWDVPLDQPISWQEAVEHGTFLTRRAVRRSFSGQHRFGVYLSGGLDSRLIVGALGPEARGLPVLNYGVTWGSDVIFARQVARVAHLDYHHVAPEHPGWTRDFVRFYTRVSFSPHHYFNGANVAVAPFAAELFDVNLSGVVGDCILGDPAESYEIMHTAHDRDSALCGVDGYFTRGHMNPGTIDSENAHQLLTPEWAATLDEVALGSMAQVMDCFDAPWDRRADLVYMHTRARRGLFNLLHCERSSVENRPVFYDYDLVDFMFSLPFPYRINRRLHTAILNRVTPRLAWVRTAGENVPPLQNKTVVKLFHWWNRLQGMAHRSCRWIPDVPSKEISQWPYYTRTDSAGWIEELLLNPSAHITSFVRQDGIRALLKQQQAGDETASWILAELATLELFLELG
jgi:asparagine synthase (glutamine-hydrolysing)